MNVQNDFSLKQFNTFGIDVSAKYFASFKTNDELAEALEFNQSTNQPINRLVLGGGSNILFTKNFNGIVLKNEIGGIEIIKEDDDHVYVKAGAGVNWHLFVLFCIEHNLAGAENLSLIPGNAGASPMQNIGAYGVEIRDIFHELDAYHIEEKKSYSFSKSDCEFGYRESIFKNRLKNKMVIRSVTYRLNKVPVFNTSYGAINAELEKMNVKDLAIKAISDAVISIRRSKLPDPAETGNAGSFFKNPTIPKEQFEKLKIEYPAIAGYSVNDQETKLAAGWLIEQAGWKGFRQGDAGCHAKQALVLVNYGHASGEEILHLSEKIIDSVKMMFGVELSREVNII